MPGHSAAFDSFYESFFGDAYMAWHDGLDTMSLASLEGEERAEAERLLTEALDSGDYDEDDRAVIACVVIVDNKRKDLSSHPYISLNG